MCCSVCAQLASLYGGSFKNWGRRCDEASASLSHQDCTAAANPDGVSGREWCYVEVAHPRLNVLCVAFFRVFLSTTPGTGRQRRATEMGLLRTQNKLC